MPEKTASLQEKIRIMLKINLQSIQYFLKVAETLNFTVAAKELYLSQPALSKQIRQLEETVGVQLLKRDTKRVELTEGGKIMFQTWASITRETEEAIQRASLANSMQKKKLKIGILEFDGVINMLIPLLTRFEDQQEEVDLEYVTYGFSELKEKLKNHELDLIFSFSSELPGNNSGFAFKVLSELQLYIIIPRKNHLYERNHVTVQDLKNETFYIFSNSYTEEMKQSIVLHCKRNGFYPAKMRFFPNITSLGIGLECGDGVTMGYQEFFGNEKQQLKFFPLSDSIGSRYIIAAWDEDRQDFVSSILSFLDNALCS